MGSSYSSTNDVDSSRVPALSLRNFAVAVSDSNLGGDQDYSDWRFSWFSSVLQGKYRDLTLN
jgi:hypothetical protein